MVCDVGVCMFWTCDVVGRVVYLIIFPCLSLPRVRPDDCMRGLRSPGEA